jgi:hypothetical protein
MMIGVGDAMSRDRGLIPGLFNGAFQEMYVVQMDMDAEMGMNVSTTHARMRQRVLTLLVANGHQMERKDQIYIAQLGSIAINKNVSLQFHQEENAYHGKIHGNVGNILLSADNWRIAHITNAFSTTHNPMGTYLHRQVWIIYAPLDSQTMLIQMTGAVRTRVSLLLRMKKIL